MEKMSIVLAETSNLGQAGQRVDLELTPADVHNPAELPTYLAGYSNWEFRADEASKAVLVDNDQDLYRTFSELDAFEPVRVKGATTGPIPEIDPRSALNPYRVIDRFVGSYIPAVTEAQRGNAYQPRQAAARRCRNALMLDRELDVLGPAGLLTTIANWNAAQSLVLGAGFNWNGGATSNPIADIMTAVENSAQPVSEVWMNQRVANVMIQHAAVRDHMRQFLGDSAPGNLATQLERSMADRRPYDFAIPGLPPIKVAAAKYRTPAGLNTWVMPNVVVLTTVPPGVPTDGEEIATSYTFRRRGPSGVGYASREFAVEGRGPNGGTMVVISMADIAIMTGNNCGGIISGVIV